MRRAILWIVLFVALTACGSGDEKGDEPAQTVTVTETASPSPAAELLALVDVCPEIEAELPKGVVPSAVRWETYALSLEGLREAGDQEAQNAIAILLPPVRRLAADPAPGMPYINADRALLAALDAVAERCKAVGSSALQ